MELGPIPGVSGVNQIGSSSRGQRQFKRPIVSDRRRRSQDDDAYTGSEEAPEDAAEEMIEELTEELTGDTTNSAETDADSADSGGALNLFA